MNESNGPERNEIELVRLGWTPAFAQDFQPYRERGLVPARVAVEHRNRYLLYTANGEITGVLTGRVRHHAVSTADFPAVGDWVGMEMRAGKGPARIHAVLPRRTRFVRKVAGREIDEQVVAANVDEVFIVVAANSDFNERRIERYLTLTWESGAEPVLVLTKLDLLSEADRVALGGAALGVSTVYTSAVSGTGLDALHARLLPGRTIALLGSSGAGKSTLINALIGEDRLRTGALRADGKGRHTTTRRELVRTPGHALLLDTPGMRELQLWAGEGDVQQAFEDIAELALHCRFTDCQHASEPDCAVREAVAGGRLDAARLESFHKLTAEARYLESRTDRLAALERKRQDKVLNRAGNAIIERKNRR